jgi:ABC-type transport system involved in cytochrome c biogenesis permease component
LQNKDKDQKSGLKLFKTILFKDIKSEVRQINDLFSIFLFDIISIFIFSSVYNFSTQGQNMPLDIFVIEVWLIIFFTLIYLMSKLFVKEKESGTLGGLISSPVSGNVILVSKIFYCLILLSFVELILFLFSVFLSAPSIENLSFTQLITFIVLGVMLPTIDLSICGSLVSAFSMYAKNKSFVLPILLFPLILPITTPIISLNIKILEGSYFYIII